MAHLIRPLALGLLTALLLPAVDAPKPKIRDHLSRPVRFALPIGG
jgi:hypothetical protein